MILLVISFLTLHSYYAHGSLKFVNEQIIQHHFQLHNIPVGGLSALYYDPYKRTFFALSDDKGKQGPPRFYELKLHKIFIKKTNQTKYQLAISKQKFLQDKTGRSHMSIDPEGIFTFMHQVFISTEGRQFKKGETTANFNLKPPALLTFNFHGRLKDSWALPSMFWPTDLKNIHRFGVKENRAFEALSLDPNARHFWLAVESSLRQDERLYKKSSQFNICYKKETKRHQSLYSCGKQIIRISQWDVKQKKMLKQVAYPMAKFIQIKQDGLKVPLTYRVGNVGLTDFLSLGNSQFLVIERAYLKNQYQDKHNSHKADAYYVQLVWVDCFKASDISHYDSLNQIDFITCQRTKTMNLQSLLGSKSIDNIEGIALGPKISTHSQLLVLVSDNNFNPKQKTQFLFFHYIPNSTILQK